MSSDAAAATSAQPSLMPPPAHGTPAGPSGETPPLTPYAWVLLGSAYISQTVAFSFFFVALSTILRSNGMALQNLGFIYLLGIAPGLKFLWAPLMDRYGFGRWGHYSRWLVLMQLALIVTLLCMAMLPVGTGGPLPMAGLVTGCLAMSFFTASQDIAADGLSTRLLGPGQLGLGNGMQMACGAIGFIAGGGGVLALYAHAGWRTALTCLTLLNMITLLLALGYREPPHARPLPVPRQQRLLDYWREIGHFWQRPDTGWRWAIIIILIQAGVFMAYSVLSPMLVDAGWSAGKIGRVVNGYSTLLGMVSMLGFGWLLRRWTIQRTLHMILPAQVLAVALLAGPLLLHAGDGWVMLGVAGYMMFYMPMGVLMSTLMMARSSAHSPATDYSLQYGIYLCAGYGVGALGLPLAQHLGYGGLLGLAGSVCLLMTWLTPALYRRLDHPVS